jgi:hypothetical protein
MGRLGRQLSNFSPNKMAVFDHHIEQQERSSSHLGHDRLSAQTKDASGDVRREADCRPLCHC